MLKKEVIKGLLADPRNVQVKNAAVFDVSTTPQNGSIRVGFTTDATIHAYVLQADGSYTKTEVDLPVFTSFYDLIASLVRQNPSLKHVERWLQYDVDGPDVNRLLTGPEVKERLTTLLDGAKITFIEEDLDAGVEVINNPFNPTSGPYTPAHNQVRWWVVDATLALPGKLVIAERIKKQMPSLDVMDIVKNFGL